MATVGGEGQGDAVPSPVPVPVVAGASGFNHVPTMHKAGLEFPVALFACFHAFVGALVALVILLVVPNNADAFRRIQDDAFTFLVRPAVSVGVEVLAAVLALLFTATGWRRCSRVLCFLALLAVIVTVMLLVRLLYAALSGFFGADIVKVAVTVAAVVAGQLALSFCGAKVTVKIFVDALQQSKRVPTPLNCASSQV